MHLVATLLRHRDALLATGLVVAYVIEIATAPEATGTPAPMDGLPVDATLARIAAGGFLASLALRVVAPLVPLILAFPSLALGGALALDASLVLLVGSLLACYSVGAWATGRWAAVGGLGVGCLIGLAVLPQDIRPVAARDVATALLLLGGAWVAGLAMREIRSARGHPRLRGAGSAAEDGGLPSPEHQDVAREIRDVAERSLSVVVMEARAGLRHLDRDPERTRRALDIIEATGGEALAETQRLVGALLAPGSPPVTPTPGLADLDYLADRITDAGLPVDLRVEGRQLPLSPGIDALAYRVVQEALVSALEHAGPARASVVVRYDEDELTLDVSDDGPGLEDAADDGMARLLDVRGAVAAAGGMLEAGPADGRGYGVVARIPLDPDW